MVGGYDSGYKACRCFWGHEPGSLIKRLAQHINSFRGLRVLDAGCGEGKNSVYLASKGAQVDAFDISEYALKNAKSNYSSVKNVNWQMVDIRNLALPRAHYDVTIAYGLLHCLSTPSEIESVVHTLQNATKDGGYNVVCAFNSRFQDLRAHPEFTPCLIAHQSFLDLYSKWKIIESSDEDLIESHPHNNIVHTHSMTRLIAQKPL